jgi:signal transduction histidine kinase
MYQHYSKQSSEPVVAFDQKNDLLRNMTAHAAKQSTSRHLLAAQEEELSYIARELHDNICQRLAMLSLKIEKAARACDEKQPQVGRQLQEIWQQCSDLAGDVQSLSHDLHPSLLDNLGLVMAVTGICREVSENNGVSVEFIHNDVPASLPREMSLSLFRLVQEALHNAVKYSGADRLQVFLRADRTGIELEVCDRGVGFDVAHSEAKGGLGLISMRERIQLLNGTFRIDSKPRIGTRVHARVPLVEESKILRFGAAH